MADRHFPVRPDLDQLKHQAKDLLRAIRRGDPSAIGELEKHHPERVEPREAKLADAQLALAKSYGLPSWPRLVLACRMTDAIWRDDAGAVCDLVLKHPQLLHEDARGVKGNWGPPMSYAANLGRDEIIARLRDLGAADLELAFDRACLQGRLDTARQLVAMGARPSPGSVMGPAETQSGPGLAFLLELGAEISDEKGDRLAPVATVLQTYCRNPRGKHQCLELFAGHGIDLPDTAPMAVHRGRIDLLEEHLRRDPGLLSRTFSHEEIYPPELGCSADPSLALHGTPLAGTTLLHLSVDNDEVEIARWLLARGADVNAKAEVDAEGFGGHTALFGCVVSQTFRVGLRQDDGFARLLLDHGADPNARASLRKRLRFVADETMHEYRDVTPLAWGERFHDQAWVNHSAMRLIAERSGCPGAPAGPETVQCAPGSLSMRYLGIDFGEARIGLALSDPEGRFAVPLKTLTRQNDRAAAREIAEIARTEEVGRLVLGEPVGLDGTRGEAAERVRRFGKKLETATGLPVELIEEALTSVAADERLREAGVDTRKDRSRIDAVAAQILLQDALDRRARTTD